MANRRGKKTGRRALRLPVIAGTVLVALPSTPAKADINLELRPPIQTVNVGETINLGLYGVSDDPVQSQCFAAIQVIITWEPDHMQLLGVDPTGGVLLNYYSPLFAVDVYGLNETNPPQDGDGILVAWANMGNPIYVTPEGTLITTFQFTALTATPVSLVDLIFTATIPPNPTGETKVFDCTIPNYNVVGTLDGAVVEIVEPNTCPADVNSDGFVDVQDLLAVLAAWSNTGGPEDINGDGVVDVQDLLELLAAWGPCA